MKRILHCALSWRCWQDARPPPTPLPPRAGLLPNGAGAARAHVRRRCAGLCSGAATEREATAATLITNWLCWPKRRQAGRPYRRVSMLCVDYAALTQAPLCSVPGCGHSDAACPAYIEKQWRLRPLAGTST
ncbi:MAG: hypothetical protein ACLRRT_02830 [Ruthenibacterium lactatiformans]